MSDNYAEQTKLFKDIFVATRDVKSAATALEQLGVPDRIIRKIANVVVSEYEPDYLSRRYAAQESESRDQEDADIEDIAQRAGILSELNIFKRKKRAPVGIGGDAGGGTPTDLPPREPGRSLTRKDAHRRTMKQLDVVHIEIGKLVSLAYDAGIPLETIVEELRESASLMYAKKEERQKRKPKPSGRGYRDEDSENSVSN